MRRTRLVGKQADLFPNWQYFAFATNRTEPLLVVEAEHREHAVVELAIRDLKDQAPAPFPLRPVRRQQRLDRDRRTRAQPRAVDQPDRPAPRPHPDRRHPPAPAVPDPRATDPHRPAMDTPDARPLALATRLRRRAHPHPRAPRAHLTPPPGAHRHRSTAPPATASRPLPENITQNHHQPTHERSRTAPAPNRHAEHRPTTNPPARRVTPPRYSVDSGLGGH